MEQGPHTPENRSPENPWEIFEKPKDDEPNPEKKKRWFDDDDKETDDKAPKKGKKTEQKPKESAKKPEKEEPRQDYEVTPEEFAALPRKAQVHILAKRQVKNRGDQLKVELAELEPDSLEAQEIVADLALIENLDAKLDNPELEVDDAVEQAYQEIVGEIEGMLNELEGNPEEEPEEEAPLEDEETELYPKRDPPKTKTTPKKAKKSLSSKDAQKPQAAATQSSSGSSGGGTSSTGSSGSIGPRQTEAGPVPAEAPSSAPAAESPQAVRRRRAGNLAVSEALTQMLSTRYEEQPPSDTTPEVTTTQDSPERVVNHISRTIDEKERQVRKLATSQVVRSPFEQASSATAHETRSTATFERPLVTLEPVHVTTNQSPERRPQAPQSAESKEASRNLKQASTGELLKIAESIRVDGTTLRNLYDQNKIDRSGLTKVIKEALKGGDVKSALKKATLGEEAQRGRKIEMRHDDPGLTGTHISTDGPKALAAQARTDQILQALQAVERSKQQAQSNATQSANMMNKSPENPLMAAAERSKRVSVTILVALSIIGATIALLFIL